MLRALDASFGYILFGIPEIDVRSDTVEFVPEVKLTPRPLPSPPPSPPPNSQ